MKNTPRFAVPSIRILPLLPLLAAAIVLQGCSHAQRLNHNAFLTLREAGYTRAHNEQWDEAYAIAVLLEAVGSGDPKVDALKSAALKKKPSLDAIESRSWLGGNHAMRSEKWPAPVLAAIALYPINVLNDLIDVASVEIGLGIGLGAKVKATEVVALGMQAEMGEALVGWRKGKPTAYTSLDNSLDLLAIDFRNGVYPADRTYGGARIPFSTDGLKSPGSTPYDFSTDYYGVGAHVMAGLVAANAEVHLIEVFDAVMGLLFIDPLNDNWIVNVPIRLSEAEKQAARDLWE